MKMESSREQAGSVDELTNQKFVTDVSSAMLIDGTD
jgi:hypothetical protein